jgi:hypothetical protein
MQKQELPERQPLDPSDEINDAIMINAQMYRGSVPRLDAQPSPVNPPDTNHLVPEGTLIPQGMQISDQ